MMNLLGHSQKEIERVAGIKKGQLERGAARGETKLIPCSYGSPLSLSFLSLSFSSLISAIAYLGGGEESRVGRDDTDYAGLENVLRRWESSA